MDNFASNTYEFSTKKEPIKKIINWIDRFAIVIIPIFLIVLAIGLTLNKKTEEFGKNLLPEMLGVAVSVYIIDKLYQRRERKKTIIIEKRILSELNSFIASYFSIWKMFAWKYHSNKRIESIDDLIKYQKEIIEKVNIDDKLLTVLWETPESTKLLKSNPYLTIQEHITCYINCIDNDISWILNEYKLHLDPNQASRR